METLQEKIFKYLQCSVNEKYSREMLDAIDKNTLRQLSYKLNDVIGIDIEKSTFTEVPTGQSTPGKMKDKIIICFYTPTELAIVENDDDGSVIGVTGVGMPYKTVPKNKKQAILSANRLFVVTQANGVSNYDIRKLRRERKEGSIALDRNNPLRYGNELDKSGYDLTQSRSALKDRLYNFTKDKKADKIKEKFKILSSNIAQILNDVINGNIPEFKKYKEIEKQIKVLMEVLESLSLYKGDIPEYVYKEIERKLGSI